jgi:aryl-alcohol dehydrogenase-like predicted oxidoreductase
MRRATAEATTAYATRQNRHADAYSDLCGVKVSRLGAGSFTPEPYWEAAYDFSYQPAIEAAIMNGCNHIDTAVSYRFRQSEREIGQAIAALIAAGEVQREELFIASKAGFLPLDYPFPKNPYKWIETEVIAPGLATAEEIITDQHCMSPAYLRKSLSWSLENLGLEALDLLYLHNPEMQLGHIDRRCFLDRVWGAFEAFEQMADEGLIGAYGVAGWNAFMVEEGHMEYVCLHDLVQIAREIGGENHHFKAIQLPHNLAKPHACAYTNQPLSDGLYYTPIQAAQALNLAVMTSSSLLRMNLFKRPFSPKAAALLGGGFENAVQYALQYAASTPGVSSALFSTQDVAHMIEDLAVLDAPQTPAAHFQALFSL